MAAVVVRHHRTGAQVQIGVQVRQTGGRAVMILADGIPVADLIIVTIIK